MCKIATQTFGLPIGDHCDIEINAEATAELTTLGHTLDAQLCTEGRDGNNIPCLIPLGDKRSITFAGTGTTFAVKAPCATTDQDVDVEITDPAWNARLEDVTLSAAPTSTCTSRGSATASDLMSFDLPVSISLLNNDMPLNVDYPAANKFQLHVAEVTPDDNAPLVNLNNPSVTINEGSSTTFTPFRTPAHRCPTSPRTGPSMDRNFSGPTLTRTYNNDLPNPNHNGTLKVTDGRQPGIAVPFKVTVRNVPPQVQLAGFPANPITKGTTLNLATQVADPGADLQWWDW